MDQIQINNRVVRCFESAMNEIQDELMLAAEASVADTGVLEEEGEEKEKGEEDVERFDQKIFARFYRLGACRQQRRGQESDSMVPMRVGHLLS